MTTLGAFLFIAVLLLCGLAMVMLIDGSRARSLPEMIGLVLVLGAGTLGTPLIWASMIGAKPTRLIILSLGFCAAGLIALLGFLGGMPRPILPRLRRPTRRDLILIVPLIPIVGAILLVMMVTLRFDLFEADSMFIWGFKAKSLFVEPLNPRPPAFMDSRLSFTHQDYPLLVPMLTAATYSLIGGVNEAAGRLIFALIFIGQTFLAFSAARRWLPPFHALIAVALLVCTPFAIVISSVGNPDTPLATFYLGALLYVLRWVELGRRADLIFCALFCAFLATTKSEGMPIAVIHAAVIFTFIILRRNHSSTWLDFGIFMTIVVVIATIWWIWRIGLPHTVDHYEAQLRFSVFFRGLSRLPIIISALVLEAMTISSWGIFWLLIPLAAIVGYKAFGKTEAQVLWILFLLHLGLYIFVYVITAWDIQTLLSVSSNRLALHLAPAGMLLIALHWSAMRPTPPPAG